MAKHIFICFSPKQVIRLSFRENPTERHFGPGESDQASGTPRRGPEGPVGWPNIFLFVLVQNKSFGFRSMKIQLKGILDLGSPTRPQVPPGGVPRVRSDGQTYLYLFLVQNKSFGFRSVKIQLKSILDLCSPTRPRVPP